MIDVYDGKHSAGSGAVITDVVQGETAVALSYEMVSAEAADNSDNMILVYPEEGSVVKADGAAVIKGAKHVDSAKDFIDYLLSSTRFKTKSKRYIEEQSLRMLILMVPHWHH